MAANFFQPGFDEQTENQNIERQRKYAELLRQQSEQSPQGSMVSGHYVAPSFTQGLAQMLKAYQGGKGMREADARQKALAEAVRGRQTEEMGQFAKLMGGAPAQATGQTYQTGANEMGDEAATVPQYSAATPGDPRAAYQFAAGAKTPGLAQAGLQGLMQMPVLEAQQAERVENRAFRKEEAEAMRAQRMQELQMRMEDSRASQAERLAAQKEMREMQIAAQRELRSLVASNKPERQAQIIQTDSGPMQLVNGQAVPIMGPDGKPVRGTTAGAGGSKPLTEGQAKGSLFLGQMRSATTELDKLPTVSPVSTAMTGNTMTNWAAGKDAQKVAQLQNQWAEAYLRAKTGAAATEGEVKGNIRTFFPVVGDGPEVIKQKNQMRRQAEQDMIPTAGPGAATAGSPVVMPPTASPQDAQAMEWARSNPNDPRAKAIMQRLGGQ